MLPGIVTSSGVDTVTDHQPAADSHQLSNSGPEWVDLLRIILYSVVSVSGLRPHLFVRKNIKKMVAQ